MKKTKEVVKETVETPTKWGVFDRRALDSSVHSVPTIDGVPVSPHILNEECPCNPVLVQYDHLFVSHNEIK